jgi:hypothetical protein
MYVYSSPYVYSFPSCAKFQVAPVLPIRNYCVSRGVSALMY